MYGILYTSLSPNYMCTLYLLNMSRYPNIIILYLYADITCGECIMYIANNYRKNEVIK